MNKEQIEILIEHFIKYPYLERADYERLFKRIYKETENKKISATKRKDILRCLNNIRIDIEYMLNNGVDDND